MKNFLIVIVSFFTQIICFASAPKLFTERDFLEMWFQRGNAISEGSFGKIYIVDFKGQQYALKQIKPGATNIDEDIQGNNMLLSGIRKLGSKNTFYEKHMKSLTKYYGAFTTEDNQRVLIFEYAPGVSFEKYLKNLSPEERYSENTFHEISIILAKYAYLIHLEHEAGTVNRDVKGQNFHVQQKGGVFSIKGLDHGTMLKLTAIDNGKQRTEAGIGTPTHMAPEVSKKIIRKKGYSPAVDVFALGCELLCAYFNFFDKQFFAQPWNVSNFLENTKPFQYLPNWEDFFTQALSENKDQKNVINLCLERLKILSNEQQKFLGNLIKDCCAFNPEHRINAAQLGYLLETFSQSFKDNIVLSYEEQKEIALETYPLSIPKPIMLMIQNPQTLMVILHSIF